MKIESGVQNKVAFGTLQSEGDTERLKDGERDREIASPLRNLAAAQLTFLLQFVERRNHDGEQLQDDRGRDVRRDAQAQRSSCGAACRR